MARQTLEEWIHETINDPDKGGRCTALALVHMTGTVENEIHVKQLPDKIDAAAIADWAEMFESKAENYAEGLPGAQTFCLHAFHNKAQRPTSKWPFVKKGFTEVDGLMTEGPTGKGLLQQMMRHNEAMHALMVKKDSVLWDAVLRSREIEARERDQLRRENVEGFNMVKELVLQLAGRNHEQEMARIEARQAAAIKGEILKWAPRLLNTVTGKEIIPQTADDTDLVEDMIDAMMANGTEALGALQAMKLPPALMAKFAHRVQQAVKAREHERNARQAADESSEANGLQ